MLESLKGEPEEDDGVEEAVQTMGPEDLQINRKKDGGDGGRGRVGVEAVRDSKNKGGRGDREKKAFEKGVGSCSLPNDP